jgi:hypothetical protein
MWLLRILLCLCFNVTSAKVGKCTTKEATDFIESSSGRRVAFLQQFPQDGTLSLVILAGTTRVITFVCYLPIF